jgi:hypothetical protein
MDISTADFAPVYSRETNTNPGPRNASSFDANEPVITRVDRPDITAQGLPDIAKVFIDWMVGIPTKPAA